MRTGILVLLLLLCDAVDLVCSAPDNRGQTFIIGFSENSDSSLSTEVFVTTSRTTNVNVTVTAPMYTVQTIDKQFTVTFGVVEQLFLDGNLRMKGSGKAYNAIQINADEEVVVYAVNKDYYSCDAYLALPVDVLGMEYYTVSWYPSSYYCQIVVIGIENDTSVNITLSSHLENNSVSFEGKSYGEGQTITTTLQKYEMLQVQTNGDLTGTYIKSNRKVGVLGGNQRTNIGIGTSSDHIVEQLAPVATWGKHFVTVPVPLRTTGDYFRFIASDDNTYVDISGGYRSKFMIARKGTFVERTIPSGQYTIIVANKPISVFQFSMSQQNSTEKSDPMLMYIPPMEQYGADYTFSTPKWSYGSYSNYFMFVVKSSEKDGLLHNGNPFPKNTTYNEIAGTNYVAGYISIPEGTHVIKHESPISVFGGYLYGVAEYETYGFPTGMRMASINAICINTITVVGDGLDNDCDGKIDEELCTAENNGFDDDGDGISDEDCAYPLPIDGVWGSWGSWSTCSVTCGSGQMLRSRNCSDPYPNYGGQPCSGNSSSFTTCNVKFASQCPSSSCLTVSFPVLTVIITVLSVAVPLAGFNI